ncbi:MAG: selenide, water dikinase SelD [Planctomycetes bacterium]|nr:selenide, water dikinase SelD [Planctomycetota bacterium]
MVDIEKRKRVMARSMALGHCICDPKKGCPCDVLLQHDVCPCAGERLDVADGPMRLTQLVERPGCASKIDAASLKKILSALPEVRDPRVLIGMPAGDDAGVYQLDDQVALVQTVDVFSPSVDDPYTFGQIAAANSVSDVYAMGGRPITALSIVGFPIRSYPDEVLEAILRGGIDKMNEAGVAVIGGHSIQDREIKAGFAVTGLVALDRVFSNAGLRPGDRLILTKPLGNGILAFAAQIGRAPAGSLEASAQSMASLNKTAAELMIEAGAHACTDITGFGLMGHLAAMASASGTDVEIVWDDLPVLPGVLQCLADGIVPGACERNRESSGHAARAGDGVDAAMLDLCFDAQTSGGLLISVSASDAEALLSRLHERGIPDAACVGSVLRPGKGEVHVRTSASRLLPRKRPVVEMERPAPMPQDNQSDSCCAQPAHSPDCCATAAPGGAGTERTAGSSEAETKFHEFLKAANAPGALDARAKKAIAVALSVLAKCEPCVKSHIKAAREMGFSQEAIDEAAWMAIAFGGAPLMMFYKPLRRTS